MKEQRQKRVADLDGKGTTGRRLRSSLTPAAAVLALAGRGPQPAAHGVETENILQSLESLTIPGRKSEKEESCFGV